MSTKNPGDDRPVTLADVDARIRVFAETFRSGVAIWKAPGYLVTALDSALATLSPPAAPVEREEEKTALVQERLERELRGCTRSHPHEDMGAICELRAEIARLRNGQAHLTRERDAANARAADAEARLTAVERAVVAAIGAPQPLATGGKEGGR